MKVSKKILMTVGIALASAWALSATPGLEIYTSTDFAYYPQSDYVAEGDHFAPLTGAYSGLEGRITPHFTYSIATPLGEHWLLKDAELSFDGNIEVTPVSVTPGVGISWTPFPFLVLSAGAQAGTGWEMIGIKGMSDHVGLNSDGDFEYINADPFQDWFLKCWAQGTFQMDAAAFWPGDWHHIVMSYTYQVYWHELTSAKDGEPWLWNGSGNRFNGLQNWQCLLLGYQMPKLKLSTVGLMIESDGFYKDSACDNDLYEASFKSISISPLCQFTFTPNDILTCMLGFSSRRSFTTDHDDSIIEPIMNKDGREWFFNRVAFSYRHTFKSAAK